MARRKDQPSLIAAGRKIALDDLSEIKRALKRRQKWQADAWDVYNLVGEVGYAVDFHANAMSRLVLYAAERPEIGAEPSAIDLEDEEVEVPDGGAEAVAAVDRLSSSEGGHSELLREGTVHLLVPGEGYLVCVGPQGSEADESFRDKSETWQMRSVSEVSIKSGTDGKEHAFVAGAPGDREGVELSQDKGDTWLRIWRRDPQWQELATSHVRRLLDVADELLINDRAFRSRARSRLTSSGILALPDSLELPDEADEGRAGDGTGWKLGEKLMKVLMEPVHDEGSAAGMVPPFVRYKANDSGKSGIEHIEFKLPNDEMLEKRSDRVLRRIAQGLNVPVEIVFGLGEAAHWGAGQIEEQMFREHVEPTAQLFVAALTRAYLWPILAEQGVENPQRFVIWYDASSLIVHPDMAQAADKGLEQIAVSMKGWRQLRGIPEGMAPEDEEVALRIAIAQALRNPGVTVPGLGGTEDALPQDLLPGPPVRPPSTPTNQPDSVTAAASDLGRKLSDIDAGLRSRLEGAADAAIRRALERAGNRLRTRARKDHALRETLRNVSALDVAATLGRERVSTLGASDLLDKAFTDVGSRFVRWCDQAAKAALDLVPNLDATERRQAENDLSVTIDDASRWFTEALGEVTAELLFNPRPKPPSRGEFNGSVLVPFDVIREAVARAGGGQEITAALGERIARKIQSLGLAVGRRIMDLVFGTFSLSGYRWDYGPDPRERPFEPHVGLDGTQYLDEGDSALGGYYVGDHKGCLCRAVPVLVEKLALAEGVA